MQLNYIEGQTPIDEDELEELKLTHITTIAELNIWELKNIQSAEKWASKQSNQDMLNEGYLKSLHKKMFYDVWKWAGKYRLTNKNIGVDKTIVATETRKLLDDVIYWLKHKTYQPLECAVRFHHRLVAIHPFPNGNGRHARLMTDILIEKEDISLPLTWGNNQDLTVVGKSRHRYISALQAADQGNIEPLKQFMQS